MGKETNVHKGNLIIVMSIVVNQLDAEDFDDVIVELFDELKHSLFEAFVFLKSLPL